MFYRLLLLILIASSSLLAEPSAAAIQQAISQNPALLQTPQAKAMMQEKGISFAEARQKLSEAKNGLESENNTTTIIMNDLNTTDVENNQTITITNKGVTKRINPFAYKTNEELRTDANEQQQDMKTAELNRYSASFYANKNTLDSSSLPTPNEYIISTGDTIGIHIYGDRDTNYKLTVQNDGTVEIAFIGPIKVAGMKFIEAKKHLERRLKSHFQNSDININIDSYSAIQVTLLGDVKYPGVYNLSSFSEVKDLLIVAKGVRETGSVREIIVKRNSKVIAKLDFYDLLFKGNTVGTILLEQGDVIIVQKAEKLVSIDGYVNNAAIFELKGNESLQKLIEYAGGMKPDAAKAEIKIDRYSDNSKFETFKVSYENSEKFQMKDGDKVYIYPLDFTAANSINIYGNIIRPGTYKLNDKKTLNEFFKISLKDGMKKFFLPNTNLEYGIINRYSDDLKFTSESFNLLKVIRGEETIAITPNDKIYIFSLNDIYLNAYVTTNGSVLIKPGKFQYIAGITIRDAINASGIAGVLDDKVRVTTYATDDFMPKTTFYSLENKGNTVLNPYDEIEVYDYYTTHILEPVSIQGQVVNPTTVYYEKGMNLSDLIGMAKGLTNRAYNKKIEIVRYSVDENQTRQRNILEIDLENKDFTEIALQAYDEVKIFSIPNWSDNESITLMGEIKFPGVYSIAKGERLSDVLKRAGGFTDEAFLNGSIFTRESIRKNQAKQYNESIAKIKRELALYNAMPANSKGANATKSPIETDRLDSVVKEAEKYQPLGRVSLTMDLDIDNFQESDFNLVLENGDTLTVPGHIDTITVFGEVFNPTSFVYNSDKDVYDYIEMASGLSRAADDDNIYVIHADGTSEPVNGGLFSSTITISRGDTIVVPLYIKENNTLDIWDSIARITASFALTVAAVNSLGVL